jgi:uncharacterized integral membrane protein
MTPNPSPQQAKFRAKPLLLFLAAVILLIVLVLLLQNPEMLSFEYRRF